MTSAAAALTRFVLRSSQVPGEHDLAALLAAAAAGDGAASRKLDFLYRDLVVEKEALSRVFPTTVGVFWTLALLTERDVRNKNLWAMLPLNGALTLGVGLRIWLCNAQLRRFWQDVEEPR